MSYETAVKRKSDRKRVAYDHYPTPIALPRAALVRAFEWHTEIQCRTPEYLLDVGAGSGAWGTAAREAFPTAVIAGTDIRGRTGTRTMFMGVNDAVGYPVAPAYDFYQAGRDFLQSHAAPVFDWVIANPPYNQAEQMIRMSMAHLLDGGVCVQLLRLAFLEGAGRFVSFYRTYKPVEIMTCVERPSYTGDGNTDATAYAVFMWVKGYTPRHTAHSHLSWRDIFTQPLSPLYTAPRSDAA